MLDLGFIRQIRLASFVVYIVGIFTGIPVLSSIALCAWAMTYLYTFSIMESAFFKMMEKHQKEEANGEEENKNEEN